MEGLRFSVFLELFLGGPIPMWGGSAPMFFLARAPSWWILAEEHGGHFGKLISNGGNSSETRDERRETSETNARARSRIAGSPSRRSCEEAGG